VNAREQARRQLCQRRIGVEDPLMFNQHDVLVANVVPRKHPNDCCACRLP
jgi:hypothetical protein